MSIRGEGSKDGGFEFIWIGNKKFPADKIEQLETKNARLRAALKPFASIEVGGTFEGVIPGTLVKVRDVNRARRALEEKGE